MSMRFPGAVDGIFRVLFHFSLVVLFMLWSTGECVHVGSLSRRGYRSITVKRISNFSCVHNTVYESSLPRAILCTSHPCLVKKLVFDLFRRVFGCCCTPTFCAVDFAPHSKAPCAYICVYHLSDQRGPVCSRRDAGVGAKSFCSNQEI